MESTLRKYFPYVGLAIILILVIIIRRNFLSIPFERDEGFYCYCGQLLLDGKIPYIDFSSMHFPGLFFSYAGILWIFGNSLEQIHTGFIFVNLITIVFLFFIGRKLFSDIIALVIAVSFALLSISPMLSGFTVQAEQLIIMSVCGALLLIIHAIKTNSAISFYFSGALICFSFMIKNTGIFFILFGGLALLSYYLYSKPSNLKQGIKNLLIYSAGVFTLFAVFMIIMIAYGSFGKMLYYLFTVAKNYASEITLSEGLSNFREWFFSVRQLFQIFWILALCGIVFIFFLNIDKYKKIILLLFIAFSFLAIVPGLRFYGHYWIQLLPALSIFISITLLFMIQLLCKLVKIRTAQTVVYFIFLFLIIMNFVNNKNYYFNTNYTNILRAVYQMNPFPEAKVIGDFIKKRTDKDDKIVVCGSEPQIYIYSERRCASRYSYIASLMLDTVLFPNIFERQKEFIDDIIRNKPKYMIYFKHPLSLSFNPRTDRRIFTMLNDITVNNYKLIGLIDMISQFNTQYLWYDEINNYKPTGENRIFIFERLE